MGERSEARTKRRFADPAKYRESRIPEREAEYESCRPRILAYQKQWGKDNPLKVKARNLIRTETRAGRLVRPKCCEDCGREGRVVAHHEDYAKPYAIDFLCYPCHAIRHEQASELAIAAKGK